MKTSYDLKQFFHAKAEDARKRMLPELSGLYDRLGEYADGNAKLLGDKFTSENMKAMLLGNLDFEQEFYKPGAVSEATETINTMFDKN